MIHPTSTQKPERILVAMSGGVDSAVTAALLKAQGFDVVGVHLQLWDHAASNVERFGSRCCSLVDSKDASKVCETLDIPYYVINAQDVFQERVVDYFVHEYLQNRTPNPCVQCNTGIKFNYLFNKADELGCTQVATGHYAQIVKDHESNLFRLLKANDANKDQTYFLFGLNQKAIARTMMPLGGLSKSMVRKIAQDYGLGVVADKADSQEICFISDEGYKDFVEKRSAPELRPPGTIETTEGDVVGDHDGLFRYTIGQRKGLKLKTKEEDGDLFYVVGFDVTSATLIVGKEKDLLKSTLTAARSNWIATIDPLKPFKCSAKIRSRHEAAPCLVTLYENHSVKVEFEQPQRAITPGQAIVFYRDDEVLGGAFIERV